ncbi:hypothetical protein Btru_002153 [Bulinus truncatus]|nr:hypothetical protein Btru_002153 [Bulinus truncatus]
MGYVMQTRVVRGYQPKSAIYHQTSAIYPQWPSKEFETSQFIIRYTDNIDNKNICCSSTSRIDDNRTRAHRVSVITWYGDQPLEVEFVCKMSTSDPSSPSFLSQLVTAEKITEELTATDLLVSVHTYMQN